MTFRWVSGCTARHAALLALPLALGALPGCAGSPTPLAPGLSGSVGAPHVGVLTDSAELPKSGPGYRRFRQNSPAYHGLPRLVRAVERAAAAVEREFPGGAPLVVGDLSGKYGGKIPRHNSHRTGRDVDFLFFVTTPRGAPTENPGFFTLEADGIVHFPDGRWAVLDVPRQWYFSKVLLADPEIDVQFLFMSRELEALLIDYALARGEDLELVWHAQTVMLQPGDSLPHGDHVHMRIACKPEEAVLGCGGGGPHWPWLDELPRLELTNDALVSWIGESDPFAPAAGGTEPPALGSAGVLEAHTTGGPTGRDGG